MTRGGSPRASSGKAKTGSVPTLDVFALRDSVVAEYKHFATSFTTIHAQDIREQVAAIYSEERYWPEPLIQINPELQALNGHRQTGSERRAATLAAPTSSARTVTHCPSTSIRSRPSRSPQMARASW